MLDCYWPTTNDIIFLLLEISEAMDKQVNPCNDFYEYACGGWIYQIKQTLQTSEYFYDRFNETKNKTSNDLMKILTESIDKNDKVCHPWSYSNTLLFKQSTNAQYLQFLNGLRNLITSKFFLTFSVFMWYTTLIPCYLFN